MSTPNIDRAAEVVAKRINEAKLRARRIAHDLAAEGLLMPALPEPDSVVEDPGVCPIALWTGSVRSVTGSPAHPPVVFIDDDTDLPPHEARSYALRILAAADFADGRAVSVEHAKTEEGQ